MKTAIMPACLGLRGSSLASFNPCSLPGDTSTRLSYRPTWQIRSLPGKRVGVGSEGQIVKRRSLCEWIALIFPLHLLHRIFYHEDQQRKHFLKLLNVREGRTICCFIPSCCCDPPHPPKQSDSRVCSGLLSRPPSDTQNS